MLWEYDCCQTSRDAGPGGRAVARLRAACSRFLILMGVMALVNGDGNNIAVSYDCVAIAANKKPRLKLIFVFLEEENHGKM